MQIKTQATILILCCLASAACTKYFWPNKAIEVKTETKEVVKNNIVTVVKEVKRPDGTVERTETTTDRTKSTVKQSESIAVFKAIDWHVSASAVKKLDTGALEPHYQLQIERRIMGPIFFGANISTEKQIGITIGLEF